MALSKREKEMLERLQAKAEEPDKAPVSRSISAHVDLTDPKSVALAIKHGFLDDDDFEEEEDEGKEGKEGKEGEETPRRRGYFGTE